MATKNATEENNGSKKVNLAAVRNKFHNILAEAGNNHIGETMNDIARALVLGMLGRFHILLFGPPGCNKSRVIRDIYGRVENALYFELLSSLYATKEDLVGPIDMQKMDEGEWIRKYAKLAPEADLMYIDETLECPDGLLKELHPIMNERIFHTGGKVIDCPLSSMAGATNVMPQDTDGIEAFLDRWLMRFSVRQVGDIKELNAIRQVNQAIALGESTGSAVRTTLTLDELRAAQEAVQKMPVSNAVNAAFGKIYKKLKSESIHITNRRAVEVDRAIRAAAWLRGAEEADTEDMSMLTWALWGHPKEIDTIVKILAEYAKDAESRARELLNAVKSAKTAWDKADGRNKKEDLQMKAKGIMQKLNFLVKQKKNEGKNIKPLMEAYKEASLIVRDMNTHP